jgi:hypothetical protein
MSPLDKSLYRGSEFHIGGRYEVPSSCLYPEIYWNGVTAYKTSEQHQVTVSVARKERAYKGLAIFASHGVRRLLCVLPLILQWPKEYHPIRLIDHSYRGPGSFQVSRTRPFLHRNSGISSGNLHWCWMNEIQLSLGSWKFESCQDYQASSQFAFPLRWICRYRA